MTDHDERIESVPRAGGVLFGLGLASTGLAVTLAGIVLRRWYDFDVLSEGASGPGRWWIVIALWVGSAACFVAVVRGVRDPEFAVRSAIPAIGLVTSAGLAAATLWRVRWLRPAWPLTGGGAVAVIGAAAVVVGWALLVLPAVRSVRTRPPRGAAFVAAAVVVAGAVVAGLVVQPGYGDRVAGPFGRYPAAPKADAPGTPRAVGQYYGHVALVDGLAIVRAGNRVGAGKSTVEIRDGLAAVDPTTDRLYWRYQRPGHGIVATRGTPGAVFVLWTDHVLTRIDARTGRIRWHHKVSAAAVFTDTTIEIAAGKSLVVGEGEIDAVDAASGKSAWRATPGARCAFDAGWPAVAGNLLAIDVRTRNDKSGCAERTAGYDLRTGHQQWRHVARYSGQPPLAVSNTLFAVGGKVDQVDILDAGTGALRRSIRVFQATDAGEGRIFDETGVVDVATGRRLWSYSPPHGMSENPIPWLVGPGLACTTTRSNGPKTDSGSDDGSRVATNRLWLYCYDAATGKLRSHAEIPVRLPAGPRDAQEDQMFRTTASAVVTAFAPGLVAVTETDAFEMGYSPGGEGLPTVILRLD